MRYTYVLASLTAAAIATPYVNVEISESSLDATGNTRHNRHRDDLNRHHDKFSHNHHRHRGNWLTNIFSSHDGDYEDDNRRNGRREDRRHDNRNDRDRDDRRSRNGNENDRNRNERNGHDRNGRDRKDRSSRGRNDRNSRNRNDRNGRDRNDRDDRDRGDEDEDRERNGRGRLSTSSWIDYMWNTDFECILRAENNHAERRNTEKCCNSIGGELYDQQGQCIVRKVYDNPREDWRDCALETGGSQFADCYRREEREVEDSLYNQRNHRNGEDRHNRQQDNDERNRDDRQNRHKSHNDGQQQVLFDRDDDNDYNRPKTVVCEISANEDQNREREVVNQCCYALSDARMISENQCLIQNRDEAEKFEQCATQQGFQDHEIRCRAQSGDNGRGRWFGFEFESDEF